MDGTRRQGRPDEEMFLNRPHDEPETPTVGPLRINKASSASPEQQQFPRAGSASSASAAAA
ncbi:MAG: hypothetical protein INR71_07125, partial [Terriglobus roseus]|nr:hypothetical protein [Terriglobus roseus]